MDSDSELEVRREAVRKAVQELLAGSSNDYEGISAGVAAAAGILREEAARAIRGPLNRHVAALPQETYAEKKSLANWINGEMRRMGLALRCPKSGEPSIIQASIGHDPGTGRFRLDYIDAQGKHRNQTVSVRLPLLDPIPDSSTSTSHRSRSGRSP